MHWCDVRPDLLDSLEQDQLLMPEIYDQLAIRFRQEPYRLKLSYILQRLKNTRDRNSQQHQQGGDLFATALAATVQEPQYYTTVDAFLAELMVINENLQGTGLHCRELEDLICQVEIYGFNLTQLDIRQDSSYHSDAITEIADYLQILPQPYSELSEAERTQWLIQELQTRRPLIPTELPFSERTKETIDTFKVARRLQEEFGQDICRTYVISMSHDVSDLLEVLLFAKEAGLYDLSLIHI